jgi:predicted DNA-binding transcriptional regulator YafY
MGRGSLKSKKDRMARLIGLLRSSEFWTTADLARELEVSHRTLMRDLAELRLEGYPIDSDRGRGGGVNIAGRWGIEKLTISNKEAIALLLCLSIVEAMTPIGDELGARNLKQKIAAAFGESQRKSITDLRKKILIGKAASPQILANFQKADQVVLTGVMHSFFESKKILIQYKDEISKQTSREVDPHFLLVNWPVWYLLGCDYLRSAVRIFRVDRITSVSSLCKTVVARPRSLFLRAFEDHFKHL